MIGLLAAMGAVAMALFAISWILRSWSKRIQEDIERLKLTTRLMDEAADRILALEQTEAATPLTANEARVSTPHAIVADAEARLGVKLTREQRLRVLDNIWIRDAMSAKEKP